jgi:hypothetical protein
MGTLRVAANGGWPSAKLMKLAYPKADAYGQLVKLRALYCPDLHITINQGS